MSPLQTIVLLLIALPVVLESVNKLERTRGRLRDLRKLAPLARLAEVLRATGWLCLLVSSAGLPFVGQMEASLLVFAIIVAVVGSACLVLRARLEEFIRPPPLAEQAAAGTDPFNRTQVLRRP